MLERDGHYPPAGELAADCAGLAAAVVVSAAAFPERGHAEGA